MLARQPGTKEARYRHLLTGPSEEDDAAYLAPVVTHSSDRMVRLEEEVAELRKMVVELQEQFAGFRKQFE
jgi:hypothetical protein